MHPHLRSALIAAGVIGALSLLFWRLHPPFQQPVSLYVCVDTSASARYSLEAFARVTGVCYTHQLQRNAISEYFRLDCKLDSIREGIAHGSVDALPNDLISALSPKATAKNTYSYLFWEKMAMTCKKEKNPFILVFLTDGYADGVDEAGHKRILIAATKLAKNPKLFAVIVMGVKTPATTEIERDLAPLKDHLGRERFLIRHETEINPKPVLELLSQAEAMTSKGDLK